MLNIILIFVIAAALSGLLIFFKDKLNDKFVLILKILGVAIFVLALSRCFMNDNFIWVINGGNYGDIYYSSTDVLQSLLRWGMYLAYIILPCAVFFKSRTVRNIAIYFCLPVAIVSTIFYADFMQYFLEDSGRGIYPPEIIRHIEFSLELIIMIALPILLRFGCGHKLNYKNLKEWGLFFGCLVLSLLVVIPVYLPQSIFGFTSLYMVPFSLQHIMWIIVILGLFVGLYFALRFKSKETRLLVVTFIALFLFLHYNSIYLMDFKMSRLPFQLCNLGSYLVLLALLFKKQSFFNFILLANVPGAIIAFAVPDISEGMLSYWNIHFYIEHTWVFVLPLLMIALRIFERPKLNAIKHFFVGFVIYFLFCSISGIIANCFLYIKDDPFFNEVNYFYLFNTTVLAVLPFLGFTRAFAVVWGGYAFYPLYMLMIFALYSAWCLIFFYCLRSLIKIGDDHFNMRRVRIDLREKRGKYANRKIPRKVYED